MTKRKPDYSFIVLNDGFIVQKVWALETARFWLALNHQHLSLSSRVTHRIRVFIKAKA